jgi:hypothetical protein
MSETKCKPDHQANQPSPTKKRKPDRQAEQSPAPPTQQLLDPHERPLIQKFAKAHMAFGRAFCNALQSSKDAGEVILKFQCDSGLKGAALFGHIRERLEAFDPGCLKPSDRSCYLYQRIASRWNELQAVAGDALSDLSLSQAVKLLQEPKDRPKDKPAPAGSQSATEAGSHAAPSMEGEVDAKPQEPAKEEPIKVQPPFDQPEKDRLAAVYAQNGPAPTPIQMMTNIVIPGLKRVAEVAVSANDVPFLANAIKEALALIDVLKQKYAIG